MTWIVGCPQSGKTTLARKLASDRHVQRNVPVCVIDSALVHNLADIQENTVDEAIAALWREPRGSARIIPKSIDDVDRMCKAIRAGGKCVLFVDEANFWLSARDGSSNELCKLMRATQHAQCDIYLTTQHLTGDVPQLALSCTNELYIFRCTAPRVLETLEKEFEVDREVVRNLPQHAYTMRKIGF